MNIFDKDLIGEKPMNPFMEVLKIKIYLYIIMPKAKLTKAAQIALAKFKKNVTDAIQNKEISKLKKDVKKIKRIR